MTFDEIRLEMIAIYNEEFVDRWMERRIPFLPWCGRSPKQFFSLESPLKDRVIEQYLKVLKEVK